MTDSEKTTDVASREGSNGSAGCPVEAFSCSRRGSMASKLQNAFKGPVGRMTESEKKYAAILDSRKIEWFYRPARFRINRAKPYEPSFSVISDGEVIFVDVKEALSARDEIRMAIVKALHPFEFSVITRGEVEKLANNCAENT